MLNLVDVNNDIHYLRYDSFMPALSSQRQGRPPILILRIDIDFASTKQELYDGLVPVLGSPRQRRASAHTLYPPNQYQLYLQSQHCLSWSQEAA
jgi:hypothetical protein